MKDRGFHLRTSWDLIEGAAGGDRKARSDFTRHYLPVVRAYLTARWRGTPYFSELDDAVQEVFVDCFRHGGILERADPARPGGFRAFLFGVVRNAALHAETRRARERERQDDSTFNPSEHPAGDEALSQIFDRAWAQSVVRQAVKLQASRARGKGEAALKRVELLRLRFQEDRPIREIARLWTVDPAHLHHEFAQARKEFSEAFRETVGLHERCPPERLEAECARLLALLE
jgi:RNA polymerase sigma factor (sigma-70 family)